MMLLLSSTLVIVFLHSQLVESQVNEYVVQTFKEIAKEILVKTAKEPIVTNNYFD